MDKINLYSTWNRDTFDEIVRIGEQQCIATSGLRKIKDAPKPCLHPEHNPPSHIVLEPGTYEHTCPGCGYKTIFEVPYITC